MSGVHELSGHTLYYLLARHKNTQFSVIITRILHIWGQNKRFAENIFHTLLLKKTTLKENKFCKKNNK